MSLTHIEFIENLLKEPIQKHGILKVANNLNDYLTFEQANQYAFEYAKKFERKISKDQARQEKSSKDSVLGKLTEETIIYLLSEYFNANQLNYVVTNNKTENEIVKEITNLLKIKRLISNHQKHFDCDILIYPPDKLQEQKRIFILSVKGTTRERIGQFLSHLFLMDQDVLNAKYGEDIYEVVFTKEGVRLKYAFVTLDWAENKDFTKYNKSGKERKTLKNTEVKLILDDHKIGGGIYVLNNLENIDGVGNFGSLVGRISDFLK